MFLCSRLRKVYQSYMYTASIIKSSILGIIFYLLSSAFYFGYHDNQLKFSSDGCKSPSFTVLYVHIVHCLNIFSGSWSLILRGIFFCTFCLLEDRVLIHLILGIFFQSSIGVTFGKGEQLLSWAFLEITESVYNGCIPVCSSGNSNDKCNGFIRIWDSYDVSRKIKVWKR